jgi:uncharacterized RDD family membrane protein YckC
VSQTAALNNPYQSPAAPAAMPSNKTAAGQIVATRMERFAGALIDALIGMAVGFPMVIGLSFALVAMGLNANSLAFQAIYTMLGTALGAGMFMAIHGYLLSTKGQTVGKMVMKTRIVSLQGEQVPMADLIVKRYLPLWIVSAIPFVGGLFGLVNALMIFRDNHHCLHDDIAGTNVVKM